MSLESGDMFSTDNGQPHAQRCILVLLVKERGMWRTFNLTKERYELGDTEEAFLNPKYYKRLA